MRSLFGFPCAVPIVSARPGIAPDPETIYICVPWFLFGVPCGLVACSFWLALWLSFCPVYGFSFRLWASYRLSAFRGCMGFLRPCPCGLTVCHGVVAVNVLLSTLARCDLHFDLSRGFWDVGGLSSVRVRLGLISSILGLSWCCISRKPLAPCRAGCPFSASGKGCFSMV